MYFYKYLNFDICFNLHRIIDLVERERDGEAKGRKDEEGEHVNFSIH